MAHTDRHALFGHRVVALYRRAMVVLRDAGVPYLVGGTYAYQFYTGIARDTKDLDLFVRPADVDRALAVLADAGYRVELTHPHFLGKAFQGKRFVDIIFSTGNGVGVVDSEWLDHAPPGTLLGVPVRFCGIVEMIWLRAFVMDRDRFDGHDITHLILASGRSLDWVRLLARFGDYWRVLFSHLLLFGFAYPGQRTIVPDWLFAELTRRLESEQGAPGDPNLCQGTLLSRSEYLHDIHRRQMTDARLVPLGRMTEEQRAHWTEAIGKD